MLYLVLQGPRWDTEAVMCSDDPLCGLLSLSLPARYTSHLRPYRLTEKVIKIIPLSYQVKIRCDKASELEKWVMFLFKLCTMYIICSCCKKKLLKLTWRLNDVLFDKFECFHHSESLEFCFGLFCERDFKQILIDWLIYQK